MEMQSLYRPDHTETAEYVHSSQSQSYKDAQVWKDLETETGFESCIDYLEFYKSVRHGFKGRLATIQRLPKDHITAESLLAANDRSSIVIYDLSEQQGSSIRVIERRHCRSGTELIQALREPPSDTRVQLVLWFFDYSLLDQEMVDALVLGLRLDVSLLDDLRTVSSAKLEPPTPKTFRASQIRSIMIDSTVAFISQNFMLNVSNAVPVVLVASAIDGGKDTNTLEKFLAGGEEGEPPIHRLFLEDKLPFERILDDTLQSRGWLYARTVEHFTVQERGATLTKAFLLLAAVSPLLYAQAYKVRNRLDRLHLTYVKICGRTSKAQNTDDLDGYLHVWREDLRRTVEATEDLVGQTFGYIGSKAYPNWSQETSYLSIKADMTSLIDRGRRLETEVRDFMQLRIGNLALEESRKSIELSNSQIREAKSVKIFTVLAFIYVPLNLATSIFGMNIQQLNRSGQNVWVFFATAVAALLVTGGSWLCSDRLASHEAVAWYKERGASKIVDMNANDIKRRGREYGLLLRVAMLIWLTRRGYTSWMRKSGAWKAILTNSDILGKDRSGATDRRACDYVSDHSRGYNDYFNANPYPKVTWASAASISSKSRQAETA